MNEREGSRKAARDAGTRLVDGHASEDPFAAAFKATRMPMIITDPRQHDNPIIFCNKAFNDLSGYSNEELIGSNCRLLQGPNTDPETVSKLRAAVASEQNIAVDILNYRKDGSTFWNALFVSPVMDEAGQAIYFFASQLDFTNIKSKEAELASARHSAEQEVEKRTRDLTGALSAKTILVHEVDHRVKNNLLMIASIVKLQAKMTDVVVVKKTLRSVLNRVEAISTVQRKLFTADDIGRFDVGDFAHELIADLVGSLRRDDIRFTTDLSPVLVPATKASPIALIVNEVVGDAVRRGLSDGGGEIHLEVRRLNGSFLLRVTDTATPVPVNAEDDAFGRLMLETCARQLNAKIERESNGHRTDVRVDDHRRQGACMKVMIVEDEALLALELESEVEMAGHKVVGQASTSIEAMEIAQVEKPDFAFVDITLVDGTTGIDVGRFLSSRNIPFVFLSGNIKRLPQDFAGAIGAIEKPYTMNGLQNALSFIQEFVAGDAGALPPPSMILASDWRPSWAS